MLPLRQPSIDRVFLSLIKMFNNNLSTQSYIPTKAISCSQTPFDIDSLSTPLDDDFLFSLKNNNDSVPLPSGWEVVTTELDSQPFQSSITKEFLGSLEVNDFEIGCFTELCAIHEPKIHNSHTKDLEESS
ncbi:hypothetical protein M5689_004084 [Euphorbia peplus]|nr:hypothetical protein M5689_004084 [Euphorbia peplus]